MTQYDAPHPHNTQCVNNVSTREPTIERSAKDTGMIALTRGLYEIIVMLYEIIALLIIASEASVASYT